jgi:hypothetical protein
MTPTVSANMGDSKVLPADVAPTTTQICSGSSKCRSNDNPDLFGYQPMSLQRLPRFIRVPTSCIIAFPANVAPTTTQIVRVPANVAPTTTQICSGSSKCRSNDDPDLFGYRLGLLIINWLSVSAVDTRVLSPRRRRAVGLLVAFGYSPVSSCFVL